MPLDLEGMKILKSNETNTLWFSLVSLLFSILNLTQPGDSLDSITVRTDM